MGIRVCAAAVVVAASVVRGDVVAVSPVDGQAETQDHFNWTMNASSDSLNASRFSGIPLERRGVMEFGLGVIPPGSTVQSAVLSYRISTFTGGPGTASVVEFHGYAGNGTVEVWDCAGAVQRHRCD